MKKAVLLGLFVSLFLGGKSQIDVFMLSSKVEALYVSHYEANLKGDQYLKGSFFLLKNRKYTISKIIAINDTVISIENIEVSYEEDTTITHSIFNKDNKKIKVFIILYYNGKIKN